jgi:hypothetical protein
MAADSDDSDVNNANTMESLPTPPTLCVGRRVAQEGIPKGVPSSSVSHSVPPPSQVFSGHSGCPVLWGKIGGFRGFFPHPAFAPCRGCSSFGLVLGPACSTRAPADICASSQNSSDQHMRCLAIPRHVYAWRVGAGRGGAGWADGSRGANMMICWLL